MITTPIRATCAFAAVASFFLAIASILTQTEWALPLALAAVFALVAMFGASGQARREVQRLAEHLQRFRTAMRVCFAAALLLYCGAALFRRSAGALVEDAAILGIAFWLVALVLAFFVVYFNAQLRAAQGEQSTQ